MTKSLHSTPLKKYIKGTNKQTHRQTKKIISRASKLELLQRQAKLLCWGLKTSLLPAQVITIIYVITIFQVITIIQVIKIIQVITIIPVDTIIQVITINLSAILCALKSVTRFWESPNLPVQYKYSTAQYSTVQNTTVH